MYFLKCLELSFKYCFYENILCENYKLCLLATEINRHSTLIQLNDCDVTLGHCFVLSKLTMYIVMPQSY